MPRSTGSSKGRRSNPLPSNSAGLLVGHFWAWSPVMVLACNHREHGGGTESTEMENKELTQEVIRAAIKVHKTLGPGLLETAYQECLYYQLQKNGLQVEKEKVVPIVYEEVELDRGYRIDLLLEGCLVLEIKSVEALNDVHVAQTLTYLRLSELELGLLINFNVCRLKEGIKRLAN